MTADEARRLKRYEYVRATTNGDYGYVTDYKELPDMGFAFVQINWAPNGKTTLEWFEEWFNVNEMEHIEKDVEQA